MMMKYLLLHFWLFSLLNAVASDSVEASNAKGKIGLTKEERTYLSQKKKIIVCDYAEWMPYIGHEGKKTFGIVYDYYKAFERRIGVPIRFVHKPDIPSCVDMVAEGQADAVVSMGTPNTFAEIALSDEFGEDFVALVTRLNTPFVSDVKTLNGKRVGIVRHYRNMIAYVKKTYPMLQLALVASTKEGLDKVANGELDAFIDIYRIAVYNIQREHIGELKINTKVDPLVMRAHVGLAKENVLLRDIFNKAIANLSAEEKIKMIDRWMRAKEIVRPDYRLLGEIVAVALLLLLGFLYYHLRVHYRQKVLLARQAKLAAMGSMINNIAHQWRQPLSRINSTVTVLKTVGCKNLDEIQCIEKLTLIEENTAYMSDTIEAFMHFFTPGKQKRDCNLHRCMRRALKLAGIEDKPVEVSLKIDKKVSFFTYEEELMQAVLVILNNAMENFKIRSVPHPKIVIRLKATSESIVLVIRDNGGGIAEEERDRIFEPYYTTKFQHEGRGLGLYMAKLLIEESMEGTLQAENKEGGAMFIITIPKEQTDA